MMIILVQQIPIIGIFDCWSPEMCKHYMYNVQYDQEVHFYA